jgi:SAM-dependent methyltransferase
MNHEDLRATRGARSDREERERLQRVYDAYQADPRCGSNWGGSPAHLEGNRRKWALVSRVLSTGGFDSRSARVLDLGCMTGEDSARFREQGTAPELLVALDLLRSHASAAKGTNPWMNVLVGDASELPFPAGRFDLVYQSTMLSSVLDMGRRARILREIGRVVAPGGIFLSYDTRYLNPWNRQTRPVRAAELREALAHWTIRVWSATLLPPLMRAVLPVSAVLCRALEALPPLRSHLLVLAIKPR